MEIKRRSIEKVAKGVYMKDSFMDFEPLFGFFGEMINDIAFKMSEIWDILFDR